MTEMRVTKIRMLKVKMYSNLTGIKFPDKTNAISHSAIEIDVPSQERGRFIIV